ncbi:hypothetical protein CS022_00760 [Veronia nyctiphanis]|uniref:Membrane-anchored protein n=1 Tax=Veronia nyctiphanis TaxID=1278244 RepID=A0A4Q0YU40_9GAMM|nr:GDYXXLXY domain-containing protein [Veronia nyctiphanis]RXJ74787.1 hypothetical protein CS022_00760 [Veronia nyctiphanis]
MTRWIVLAGLCFALLMVNLNIVSKETLLTEGKPVFLRLAPVDPRSLLQGDYMRLDYALSRDIYAARQTLISDDSASYSERERQIGSEGFVVLKPDERNVGQFVRLDDGTPIKQDEIKLAYKVHKNRMRIAVDSFFFQEGHAKAYETARYAEYRVSEQGDWLLASLFDEQLNEIDPVELMKQSVINN